ncbi:MAG TPA: isochorismatase family cysteine hydrolase [Chloroflexota bacterium]|jgi:nicotinamidase-related amidase
MTDNVLLTVFPPFPVFDLEPTRTALIVVDMQYLDAHPEHGIGRTAREAGAGAMFADYWPAVRNALACQQRLITAAHEVGVQVIFTRIATQTRDARDVGRQHRLVGLPVPRDSQEACLLAELPVGPDDLVLSKTSSSPFNSTSIDRFLRNLDIRTLLLCGVVTNGCVEGTVRDASDLGYEVVMVEDACAAVTPALHQAAITNLKDAFCNCRTTEDVVRTLEGSR